jgi:hypothetical protein
MNEPKHNDSIQSTVLEKVRAGTVRRKPKLVFVLRVIALIVASALFLTVSIFLISFILFSLHESGEQFLLGYGLQGIGVFLSLFPWMLFAFDLALLFTLEWLLRSFSFGYRIPFANVFIALLGGSVVLGLLVTLTPLHGVLLRHAIDNDLTAGNQLYGHVLDAHPEQGIYRGIVVSASSSMFTMTHQDYDHDGDEGQYQVVPAPGVQFTMPASGDRVLVFGKEEQEHILADHIQILQPLPTR